MTDSPPESAVICLASQSQPRLQLMHLLGLSVMPRPMDIDETRLVGEHVCEYVERLAQSKAQAAFSAIDGSLPTLGADTVVFCREQVLTKPFDAHDAARMLEMLSGCTHQVYTGAAIVSHSGSKHVVVETQVTFGKLSERDIKAYVESGEPMGKAGAYAIQGLGQAYVSRINGSYSNVVGLPLFEVRQLLAFANIILQ